MTKVAVLMGGMSAEREVSLSSAKGVCAALKELGYDVTELDVDASVSEKLDIIKPDVCFNALHGRYGEDGCIQGLLELKGIPYTHSSVMASAIAMNKAYAKIIFKNASIPVVDDALVIRGTELITNNQQQVPLDFPYVIKPVSEGSSVGVHIVQNGDNLEFLNEIKPDEEYLIEKYIPGREVQAAVMGSECLGAIEIRPLGRFYDYEAKYTGGKAEHIMPAPIHPKAYKQICEYAVAAHKALGCKGVTRSDFRYDDTNGEPGRIFILETNTQPGMTPLSLTPEIAAYKGIGYKELVDSLVKEALCQKQKTGKS